MLSKQTMEQLSVDKQVIVTGPLPEVDKLLADYQDQLLMPQPRQLMPMSQELVQCMARLDLPFGDCLKPDVPWTIDLYDLRDDLSADRLLQEMRERPCIFADPNWLTGYRHSIGGSRHTVRGSRHTVRGSRGTVPGGPDRLRGGPAWLSEFWTQWAFQEIGLIGKRTRLVQLTGKGVKVGLFDTSPFRKSGVKSLNWLVPDLTQAEFELPVRHLRGPEPQPLPSDWPLPDLSDHGLAVAALIHAVAPESSIRLYRVMDEHARGDLSLLVAALGQFIQYAGPGGVINLSLGVHPVPGHKGGHVYALAFLLAYAHCLGLVVVAAAGNDSWGLRRPEPAQLPACYGHVVAAQASNVSSTRAAFSNLGDIAAPGRDVISLDVEWPSWEGFCYWTGTSFAAPLISGMAALILERHTGPVSAADVQNEIKRRAQASSDRTLPNGIISLRGL
jgi:subtilisin family serine protease